LTGVQAFLEVASPGREMVCPGADGVDEATDVAHLELASPAIVAERDHGRFSPATDCRSPVEQDRPDLVVPVDEGVGFDDDPLAYRSLDREAAGVNLGLDALDDGPASAFVHRYALVIRPWVVQ